MLEISGLVEEFIKVLVKYFGIFICSSPIISFSDSLTLAAINSTKGLSCL